MGFNLESSAEYSIVGDALCMAKQPAADTLFVGGARGKIYCFDLQTSDSEPRTLQGHISYVSSLVLVDGLLLSAGSDHRMIWWDSQSHEYLGTVAEHPKWVRQLALSPDEHMVASVCDDMVCRLWETKTGRLIRSMAGHEKNTPGHLPSKLYGCTFSHDGKLLATADQVGRIVIFEAETGQETARIQAENYFVHDTNGHGYGGVRTLAFSPDRRWLAVGGNQAGDTSNVGGSKALVQVFDVETSAKLHEFTDGGNNFIESLQFLGNGQYLIAAGGAGTEQKITFYDLNIGESVSKIDCPFLVFGLQLDEGDQLLYAVGRKGPNGQGQGHIIRWQLTVENDAASDQADQVAHS